MTTELNPKFTFETLVVGAGNRLAVTAARTVAENPGAAYNPLFIYSASGLGKTHLLMAIGHEARVHMPKTTVAYLTLDEFVEAFHAAVGQGEGETFRRRFRAVEVLLVDDVQFLSNRKEMQSELLRITEAVQQAGHQMVLTSDRPPSEIADLDERLISRFAGGLVVDIGTPDYETRVAILRRKAEERGAAFEPEVLNAVAASDVNNVRELLGRINQLVAVQAMRQEPLTPEVARQVLGLPPPVRAKTNEAGAVVDEFAAFVDDIADTVAKTVEAWRTRVAEAILRWEGEGYRTWRLEALLKEESAADVDEAVRQFEADVTRLRELAAEVETLDPASAGAGIFRDPDRVKEAEDFTARVREGVQPPPGPSPALTFDTFVAGPANTVATNAGRAVIDAPGHKYNPLVLVGASGVGKSHLLQAIGNALAQQPGAIVACASMEAFIDELITAIDAGRVEQWRARYRRATALLLDDAHLVAGKDRTQEELFHLFNHFTEHDRQLIFTSNQPVAEVEGLEPRLVSRLQGGLVAELQPPDRDLRFAYAERRLADHGSVDDDLAGFLANRPAESMRSVQRELQQVLAGADAEGRTADLALAKSILEGAPAAAPAAARRVRTSGIVVSSAGALKSREKVVWEWPDIRTRMIEELR